MTLFCLTDRKGLAKQILNLVKDQSLSARHSASYVFDFLEHQSSLGSQFALKLTSGEYDDLPAFVDGKFTYFLKEHAYEPFGVSCLWWFQVNCFKRGQTTCSFQSGWPTCANTWWTSSAQRCAPRTWTRLACKNWSKVSSLPPGKRGPSPSTFPSLCTATPSSSSALTRLSSRTPFSVISALRNFFVFVFLFLFFCFCFFVVFFYYFVIFGFVCFFRVFLVFVAEMI